MTRFLLDTTFIIDVLNDQRKRLAVMKDLIAQRHELACCAINVAEVYAGMRQPETEKTEALLKSLEYVPISWEASKLAGELRQEWARKGKTFLLADMIIAAVCLTGAMTLVTDNRKDFAMPGLTLHPLP
jgi:predicted nucleic acid-binding protein